MADLGFKILYMRLKMEDHTFMKKVCKSKKITMTRAFTNYIEYLRTRPNFNRYLLYDGSQAKVDIGDDGRLYRPALLEQERQNDQSLPI